MHGYRHRHFKIRFLDRSPAKLKPVGKHKENIELNNNMQMWVAQLKKSSEQRII